MQNLEEIENLYKSNIEKYSKDFKSAEEKIKTISYTRLFTAIGIIFCFYFSLTFTTKLFYILILLIIIFGILISIHSRLFRKKSILLNFVQINKDELSYLKGDYSSFINGENFLDYQHPYTFDLDIFGKGSFFQSVCRTTTIQGTLKLSQFLSRPILDVNAITSRQLSVKELKEKTEFRQKFQAMGLLLNETPRDLDKIISLKNESYYFLNKKWFPYLLYILPAITISGGIISIIQLKVHFLLTIGLIANTLFYGLNNKNIQKIFTVVSRKKLLLENYSNLIYTIEKENFTSKDLANIKLSISNGSKELHKLASIVGWFDQRLNILISPFLNIFLLFDLQCCYRIEKWRNNNDEKIIDWIDQTGEIDALCSLGTFTFNNDDFQFPEFSSKPLYFEASNLCHPLIKKSKRKFNDFKSDSSNQVSIVTGANMAGKSTFLRTVGINMVLAYAGAPVCAQSLKLSLMNVITSMRISDSLQDDTSYFYAELRRLKFIKEQVQSEIPSFVLLDEMLKGTNSNDKQQGSQSFTEGLINYNCLVIVATHDLMLGNIENKFPDKAKNFCFESMLENNELRFDYKIRNGVAQNTNASFLMKNLGII